MSLDHTAVLEHPGVQMGRRAVEILEGSRQENTVLSMLALSPSLIFVISFSCFTFSSRDVVNIFVVEQDNKLPAQGQYCFNGLTHSPSW